MSSNRQIIADAAVRCGMLSREAADRCLEENREVFLHTIHAWRLMYPDCIVKAGEERHGMEVKLWKKREDGKFYLAKSYLYRLDQIETTTKDA